MPVLRKREEDKGLPALVTELWHLVVAYVKQETIEPVKALTPFLKWGLLGTVSLMIGLPTLFLALLRALQAETSLTGQWSWVPYVIVMVVLAAVAGLLARRISKGRITS